MGRDDPTGDKVPESNDEQGFSRRLDELLNGAAPSPTTGDGVVDLDVSRLVPADLCAVDALARLQVAAARRGRWLLLHSADGGLLERLEFIGLDHVVHLCPCCRGTCERGRPSGGGNRRGGAAGLGSRVDGEAEPIEQRRVAERVDGADSPGDDVEDVDGEHGGWASRRLRPVDGSGRRPVGVDRREQMVAEGVNGDQPATDVARAPAARSRTAAFR